MGEVRRGFIGINNVLLNQRGTETERGRERKRIKVRGRQKEGDRVPKLRKRVESWKREGGGLIW